MQTYYKGKLGLALLSSKETVLNTISLNDGFMINDYGSNDKQTPSYVYQYAKQHIEELKNKAIEQVPDAKLATEFNVVSSVIEDDMR